jgi:hypothetical protein
MKAGRAVRFSLAAVIFVTAAMAIFFLLNRGEASAACDDRGAGSGLSLLCVKPTTTTFVETTTTTLPEETTTTTLPEETTTTTLPEETTTTALAAETTSTIPTEVLPTVITASTTSTTAEVGGIVVLPFTGSSEGALLGLAIGLVALGTIAVNAVRGSRTED